MNYKSKQKENQRLETLYEETKTKHYAGAYPNRKRKNHIMRFNSSSPGYRKWLKRCSNKKVRHNKGLLQNSDYCKVYDNYWND